jgi:hypothetical protein
MPIHSKRKDHAVPKWVWYFLLAILDFGFAWYFYSTGRIVFPAIAVFAGVGFVAAGIGTLVQQDKQA